MLKCIQYENKEKKRKLKRKFDFDEDEISSKLHISSDVCIQCNNETYCHYKCLDFILCSECFENQNYYFHVCKTNNLEICSLCISSIDIKLHLHHANTDFFIKICSECLNLITKITGNLRERENERDDKRENERDNKRENKRKNKINTKLIVNVLFK